MFGRVAEFISSPELLKALAAPAEITHWHRRHCPAALNDRDGHTFFMLSTCSSLGPRNLNFPRASSAVLRNK